MTPELARRLSMLAPVDAIRQERLARSASTRQAPAAASATALAPAEPASIEPVRAAALAAEAPPREAGTTRQDIVARLARLRTERHLDERRRARPDPDPEPGGGSDAREAGGLPGVRHEGVTARRHATVDRAGNLARAIGGEIVRTAGGRIVRVQAAVDLPVPFDQFASLPYPVEPGRPLVCLDTETTGLGTAAGTMAFLVGIGRWDGSRFEVEQLVLPDHPDEPAFLAALRDAIPSEAWLVTYNGRGFDWPLLVTRFRLHRSPPPDHAGHLDLLPVARQLWRHRLDDARLASVERGVAGVVRVDDLPGALVPARYLEFLRTGEALPLRAVVDHNRQDVVSLGLLVAHLATRLATPSARSLEPPGDLAALGRAYARRRRFEEAISCCDAAVDRVTESRERERLVSERARVLRLAGRHEESAAAWRDLAEAGGSLAAVAWVQLAKHLEHVRRDPVAALDAADRALGLVERQRDLGLDLPRLEHDLTRRRARLRRRVTARPGVGAARGRAAELEAAPA